jgi:hypothetical protein
MTERLVRTAPPDSRAALKAMLEDLEWTAQELTIALKELEATAAERPVSG